MGSGDDATVREMLRERLRDDGRGAQSRLARDLGVTPQTISKWLTGEIPVHPKWYPAIARSLDLNLEDLARTGGYYEALGLDGLSREEVADRWERIFPITSGDLDVRQPARRAEPEPEGRPEMPEGVIGIAALAGELTPEDRAKVEAYIQGLIDGK